MTSAAVQPQRRPGKYEIDAAWESDEIKTYHSDITIPATAVTPGRTYRVRCRMKDNTGRWSHWSNPVQFVAGEPLAAGILADLRITEVMYNPPDLAGDGIDNNEFEFIELKNIGDETLDLTSVSFDKRRHVRFRAAARVTTLGPGKFVLVVKNKQAFLSRYGPALSGLDRGRVRGQAGQRRRDDLAGRSLERDDCRVRVRRRPRLAAGRRRRRAFARSAGCRPCSMSRKAP